MVGGVKGLERVRRLSAPPSPWGCGGSRDTCVDGQEVSATDMASDACVKEASEVVPRHHHSSHQRGRGQCHCAIAIAIATATATDAVTTAAVYVTAATVAAAAEKEEEAAAAAAAAMETWLSLSLSLSLSSSSSKTHHGSKKLPTSFKFQVSKVCMYVLYVCM